jgi:hypothetical protein
MKCIILKLIFSLLITYIFQEAYGSNSRCGEYPEAIEKQDHFPLEASSIHLDRLIAEYKKSIPETLSPGPIADNFLSTIPSVFYQLYDQISEKPSLLTNRNCSELALAIFQTHAILKPFSGPFSPIQSSSELAQSNKHSEEQALAVNQLNLSAKNKYADLLVFIYNLICTPEFKLNTPIEELKKLEDIATPNN